MRRSPLLTPLAAALLLAPLAGCGSRVWGTVGRVLGGAPTPAVERVRGLPATRAERTRYRETSRYDDVVAFLDSLQRLGLPLRVGTVGRSAAGRPIPYVIASRPLVATAHEARRLGRPIVYVQGNIHGGEVEGKEALQALLRDLAAAPGPSVLDSIVLVAVPIYNVDGNERLASQSVNRTEQHGPELVGERANGQGLDLNRDYVKADAPETRGSLAMFREWDPDVFVDLHTTNGSYHGYALTYSPSLHPSAPLDGFTRDTLLAELRERMRRRGFETFDYGNFARQYGADVDTDTVKQGWFTYDHRPRFGTNYYGLRNRVAILSEAYSHDPFERRVRATTAFVRELLSLVAERRRELLAGTAAADRAVADAPREVRVALRAELTRTPAVGAVIAEDLERADGRTPAEPGMARGLRRTGRFRTLRIPVHDRFTPTLVQRLPWGYVLEAADSAVADRLRAHGVLVETLSHDWTAQVELFVVDSLAYAARPYQGHREVRMEGRWRRARRTLTAGSYVVRAGQPLGRLAAVLLEPASDDGLATWNAFDAGLRPGGDYPVARIVEPVRAAGVLVAPSPPGPADSVVHAP